MGIDDEELERKLRNLPEVPFPDQLKQQIRQAQLKQQADRSSYRSVNRWRNWTAGAAGVVAASLFLWGTWHLQGPGTQTPVTSTSKAQMALRASSVVKPSLTQPLTTVGFGLQLAPISKGSVWLNTEPGYPAGSFVFATLTNVGTSPVSTSNVIGVLSFHKHGTPADLSHSDWITFVNGPTQPLLPGSSTTWSFRPLGAPRTASGKLTEQPSLQFYNATLVPASQADLVWKTPQIKIANVKAAPRKQWSSGQSARVTADLINTSNHDIALSHLLAIVWFSGDASKDFTQPDVIRFMNNLQTLGTSAGKIAPGQKVTVYFDLIGPLNSDFGHLVPHVALIDK